MNKLNITLAQFNPTVGDIHNNAQRVLEHCHTAHDKYQTDIIIFPEMVLTGYPPEDLLFREYFHKTCQDALETIQQQMPDLTLIIGMPWKKHNNLYNSAVILQNHAITAIYHKQQLPNHTVFDEHRYFTPGNSPSVLTVKGVKCGILICEDLWHETPSQTLSQLDIDCILSLNASPFDQHKQQQRINLLTTRAQQHQSAIFYCNLVGGQDELVFDGGSMVVDQQGHCIQQALFFDDSILTTEYDIDTKTLSPVSNNAGSHTNETLTHTYQALVLGLKDYVNKNGFPGVLLGLSGGIDSALSLAIAYDALGADRVTTVMMPSQYTSTMSLEDAKIMAEQLDITHHTLPIDTIKESFLNELSPLLTHLNPSTTAENIQARTRGTLLMALSNHTGNLVITTGNRSELAVGYCTLYGDMAGGFCVLKDVPKTLVYALANHRNKHSSIIPQRIIDRPPTAELAADQTDQDTLPPYDELDNILYQLIDKGLSVEAVTELGYDSETVNDIAQRIRRNEYKRRQGAIGVRISEYAFGKDRRYPITHRTL